MSKEPYSYYWFTEFLLSDWIEDLLDVDPGAEVDIVFEEIDGASGFQYIHSASLGTLQDGESFSWSYPTYGIVAYLSSEDEEVDSRIEQVESKNATRKPGSRTGHRKDKMTKRKLFPKKEPLCDIITSDKHVKVITELPYNTVKEQIGLTVADNTIQIITPGRNGDKDYTRKLIIPSEADTETGRAKFNNGILEIVFDKSRRKIKKYKKIGSK
jgi:HSP20 family molecular chaperone IbpA